MLSFYFDVLLFGNYSLAKVTTIGHPIKVPNEEAKKKFSSLVGFHFTSTVASIILYASMG